MIDLMNGQENIPCPSCNELNSIAQYVAKYAISDLTTVEETIKLMGFELNMRRAREEYELAMKEHILASINKKIDEVEQ
jgi:hypothetical protein